MKKLFIFIILMSLISCEYDYIVTDINHPQEYVGIWNRDSIYVDGHKTKDSPIGAYFNIYQETVEINRIEYNGWKVDKTTSPYNFIVLDEKRNSLKTYTVIKQPTLGKMELKLDSMIIYLYKVR